MTGSCSALDTPARCPTHCARTSSVVGHMYCSSPRPKIFIASQTVWRASSSRGAGNTTRLTHIGPFASRSRVVCCWSLQMAVLNLVVIAVRACLTVVARSAVEGLGIIDSHLLNLNWRTQRVLVFGAGKNTKTDRQSQHLLLVTAGITQWPRRRDRNVQGVLQILSWRRKSAWGHTLMYTGCASAKPDRVSASLSQRTRALVDQPLEGNC